MITQPITIDNLSEVLAYNGWQKIESIFYDYFYLNLKDNIYLHWDKDGNKIHLKDYENDRWIFCSRKDAMDIILKHLEIEGIILDPLNNPDEPLLEWWDNNKKNFADLFNVSKWIDDSIVIWDKVLRKLIIQIPTDLSLDMQIKLLKCILENY